MRAVRNCYLTLTSAFLLVLGAAAAAQEEKEPEPDPRIPAPEFPAGVKWLQSDPLTLQGLRGKIVLIDFWEYTCVNCIRTFPYLKSWHEKYRDKGLVIIGVHTPEFAFAKNEANILKGARKFGLSWPMVNDRDFLVWRTWGNRYWPAKYLIDAQGNVRYLHFGEGAYETTESWIQKLLKEAKPDLELPGYTPPVRGADKPGAVCYPVTPELYLGWERGGHAGTLANAEGYRPSRTVSYKDPGKWEDGMVYLQGAWKNDQEALISAKTAYLGIKYHALEVNAVLKPENGRPVRVLVSHDGKPVARKDRGLDIQYDAQGRSYLLVDQPKMYSIIRNAAFAQRTLKLAPQAAGMGIYTFTFSSCEVPQK